METTRLEKLQFDEDERCGHQATRVAKLASRKRDLVSVVRLMYQDKISLGRPHAYHQIGSLGRTALLNPATVVEIFPYLTPQAFRRAIGLAPQDIANLAREHVIYPLIHSFGAYKGLDYLDPILSLNPPSYQSRGRALLDTLSNNRYEEYYQKAITSPILRGEVAPMLLREPYEDAIELPPEEKVRKAAVRYASMCCLLGEDAMESLAAHYEREIVNYVHILHVALLHPVTHGLLGNVHKDTKDYSSLLVPEYTGITACVERILLSAIGLSLPAEPTFLDIMRAHEEDLPTHFVALEQELLSELKKAEETNSISIEEIESKVHSRLYEIEAKLARLQSAIQIARTTTTIGFLGGGALALLKGLDTVGNILFGLTAATPIVAESLVRQVTRLISPILSHYWTLKLFNQK
ncbi:MAG: hypothetical protein AB1791_10210 [Chloroflexota bacterium]